MNAPGSSSVTGATYPDRDADRRPCSAELDAPTLGAERGAAHRRQSRPTLADSERPDFDENFADSGQVAAEQGENRRPGRRPARPARRRRAAPWRSSTTAPTGSARCAASRSTRAGSRPCPPPGSASSTPDRRPDPPAWTGRERPRSPSGSSASLGPRRAQRPTERGRLGRVPPAPGRGRPVAPHGPRPTAATPSAWPAGSSAALGHRGHPAGDGRRPAPRRGQGRSPASGTYGRVVATLSAKVAGAGRGRGLVARPGACTRRVGLYLRHARARRRPARLAGSADLHRRLGRRAPPADSAWTVDPTSAAALKAADDD